MLQGADDVGCDALGRVVLHQKARLAVLDYVGDSAHGGGEDGSAAGHSLVFMPKKTDLFSKVNNSEHYMKETVTAIHLFTKDPFDIY